MVDYLIDGEGNSSLDLPDDELDESPDSYGEADQESAEPKPKPMPLPLPQQQRQQQQQTIPLPSATPEVTLEQTFAKLFTERVEFTPGGLVALQELVDLPCPSLVLLAEGLDEAVLTLSEGFFGEQPYLGIRTFTENDDEIREVVAMDFLTVFEEQGTQTDTVFNEKDLREMVPLLLMLTGRAMQEQPLPPATDILMDEFWAELEMQPDAPTADLDRVSTWYFQSRLPPAGLLKGLRKVMKYYLQPGRLPH